MFSGTQEWSLRRVQVSDCYVGSDVIFPDRLPVVACSGDRTLPPIRLDRCAAASCCTDDFH